MNKKVLVVDDDPVVRVLITEFLQSRGYDVETLENGSSCLEKLHSTTPDILVLDMLMPDLTGIEVLKNIRKNPGTAKLPIVMLSADTDSETVVLNNNLSADCDIRKPFGVNEIVGAVDTIADKCAHTAAK